MDAESVRLRHSLNLHSCTRRIHFGRGWAADHRDRMVRWLLGAAAVRNADGADSRHRDSGGPPSLRQGLHLSFGEHAQER